MRLIEMLEAQAASSESVFRRALAKEDAARIAKMAAIAREQPSLEAFLKHGLFVGWTRDDLRTAELKEHLIPLMEAVYAHVRDGEANEGAIAAAWTQFNAHRMKVLVHCL
jgi:hypothetical protein